MLFEKSIRDGYARKVEIDSIRSKSLIKSADDTLIAVKEFGLNEYNYNSILRELYESLRQYCEAIGYKNGYKFLSHEVITYFIKEILKEEEISVKFDRYRQLRNGINYYGKSVAKETVEKAKKEIPEIIKKLKQYL